MRELLETILALTIVVCAAWIYGTFVVLAYANWQRERRGG